MMSSLILINCAIGGLVDEKALADMLESGRMAGARFDVLGEEPPDEMELLKCPNFLVTPHIEGSSYELILAIVRAAIDGLDDNCIT